jgi:DNA-binding NarL/FixJ family response regulator
MDLQMPQMSGLDEIIAIRAAFPEVRIFLLNACAGDVQAPRALEAGARAYLLKDAVDVALLDTIRAVEPVPGHGFSGKPSTPGWDSGCHMTHSLL